MRGTFEWLNSAKTINNALIGIAVACAPAEMYNIHVKKQPMHSVRVRQLTGHKAFWERAAPPVQRELKFYRRRQVRYRQVGRRWAPFSTSLAARALLGGFTLRKAWECALLCILLTLPSRCAIKCYAPLYCARKIKKAHRGILSARRYRRFHY